MKRLFLVNNERSAKAVMWNVGVKMETFCRLPEQICNLSGVIIKPEDFEVSIVSPVEQVEYPEEFLSFDACLDQMSKWYK